jgi:hypothetical protein
MKAFPFPNQHESFEELKRDILYGKIPSSDMQAICKKAWNTGSTAAENILKKYDTKSIKEIISLSKLGLEWNPRDNVAGNVRYFSEYYSGQNKIIIYEKSVKLWAKENKFTEKDAVNLILSHEYYHFLECTELGLTSKQYLVPTLKLGNLVILKAGIKALSEIGAHGFSRRFFELTVGLPKEEGNGVRLMNSATNLTEFEGKNIADKVYLKNLLKAREVNRRSYE